MFNISISALCQERSSTTKLKIRQIPSMTNWLLINVHWPVLRSVCQHSVFFLSPVAIVYFRNLAQRHVCRRYEIYTFTSGAGTAYPSGAPEFTPGF